MNTKEQIAFLISRIETLEQENKNLHETVAYLTKKLFGKSSETSKSLGIEGQMSLFNEVEACINPTALEPSLEEVETVISRKKYPGQRQDKLSKLPHDMVLLKLRPEELSCPHCAQELSVVGKEFVRSEAEYIPATMRIIDYYREAYECRKCKHTASPYMVKSVVPAPVLPHSYASASAIAHILYQKFVNHIPLYRQETDFKNLGLSLSRQTMSNWIMEAAGEYLEPLVGFLHQKLLQEKYLHADETTVSVHNEENRKDTTDSYMWVYATRKESETPIRIFEYHPTRNGDSAKAFLNEYRDASFQGYLISDAYAGYEKVEQVVRCFCWSHLRRYFVDALPKDVKSLEATLPRKGIEACNALFKLEDQMKKLTQKERKQKRQEQSKPHLEAFFAWVEQEKDSCLPKSKLARAFGYALNQKEGLMRFLEDGNIPISNNLAENSIRPFTVGRRNWLFCGSPTGAEASATVYSIIETAKANQINPYRYLLFLLKYLPGVRHRENPEQLEVFLPWDKEVQEFCNQAEKN